MDPLQTAEEAAATLRIGRRKLSELTKNRELPHYKLGKRFYFKPQDLEAFIEAQRVPAAWGR